MSTRINPQTDGLVNGFQWMPHGVPAASLWVPVVYVIIMCDNTCGSVPRLTINDVFTPWWRHVHTSDLALNTTSVPSQAHGTRRSKPQ